MEKKAPEQVGKWEERERERERERREGATVVTCRRKRTNFTPDAAKLIGIAA